MNSQFLTYLQLGFDHISDLAGYDHILFIVALCAIYRLSEWKRVALLVTAFTIGHSLTLALAAMDVVQFPSNWIEFLIPVTIVLTALYNVLIYRSPENLSDSTQARRINLNYLFALIFGLIHGMGFSNFFKSAVMPGEESSFLYQLLAFNIGVELGQLMIVAAVLLTAFIFLRGLKFKAREWNLFVSGAAFGIALIMAIERWPGV